MRRNSRNTGTRTRRASRRRWRKSARSSRNKSFPALRLEPGELLDQRPRAPVLKQAAGAALERIAPCHRPQVPAAQQAEVAQVVELLTHVPAVLPSAHPERGV